jgi:hypothetical protein
MIKKNKINFFLFTLTIILSFIILFEKKQNKIEMTFAINSIAYTSISSAHVSKEFETYTSMPLTLKMFNMVILEVSNMMLPYEIHEEIRKLKEELDLNKVEIIDIYKEKLKIIIHYDQERKISKEELLKFKILVNNFYKKKILERIRVEKDEYNLREEYIFAIRNIRNSKNILFLNIEKKYQEILYRAKFMKLFEDYYVNNESNILSINYKEINN